MNRRPNRRWWLVLLLGLLAIGDEPSPSPGQGQARPWSPVMSAKDARLESLRRASRSWESRQGPDRSVVDLVCLVPDLPTFLEAVSTWDRGHYFPVLFDDVESSFRFIRAFRPARVVRMPKSSGPIPPNKIWDRAVEAVGSSWKSADDLASTRPRGDAVPKSLGATTQGVVFSSPTAPMLAGAVALAAGRFQPLIRLDSGKRYGDVLTIEEADAFARTLARQVAQRMPSIRISATIATS